MELTQPWCMSLESIVSRCPLVNRAAEPVSESKLGWGRHAHSRSKISTRVSMTSKLPYRHLADGSMKRAYNFLPGHALSIALTKKQS